MLDCHASRMSRCTSSGSSPASTCALQSSPTDASSVIVMATVSDVIRGAVVRGGVLRTLVRLYSYARAEMSTGHVSIVGGDHLARVPGRATARERSRLTSIQNCWRTCFAVFVFSIECVCVVCSFDRSLRVVCCSCGWCFVRVLLCALVPLVCRLFVSWMASVGPDVFKCLLL